MKDHHIEVMYTEEEVDRRIQEIGDQITRDYEGKQIHMVCVLKGGAFFMCELAKRIRLDVSLDFMSASSYGSGTESSGLVRIVKDLDEPLKDKDVIVVDRLRPEMHPDPDLKFTDYREVGNLLKVKPFKTPKMLLATDPAKVPFFQKELERRYSDSLFFAQSEPHLIEVMPKGVDKGAALKRLANILEIELKETMAMGDNTNDILLLQAAGVAVAVANAVPKVKAVADYVCKNTRSRGVAEALKRFCL